MPRSSPYEIVLSDDERDELEARAGRYSSLYAEVVRAKIVLMAAPELRNDEIAARPDTQRQVVSKWRKHFFEQRLAGLTDLPREYDPRIFLLMSSPRSGRWPVNSPPRVCELIAFARFAGPKLP